MLALACLPSCARTGLYNPRDGSRIARGIPIRGRYRLVAPGICAEEPESERQGPRPLGCRYEAPARAVRSRCARLLVTKKAASCRLLCHPSARGGAKVGIYPATLDVSPRKTPTCHTLLTPHVARAAGSRDLLPPLLRSSPACDSVSNKRPVAALYALPRGRKWDSRPVRHDASLANVRLPFCFAHALRCVSYSIAQTRLSPSERVAPKNRSCGLAVGGGAALASENRITCWDELHDRVSLSGFPFVH